jgi:hypothetical protein
LFATVEAFPEDNLQQVVLNGRHNILNHLFGLRLFFMVEKRKKSQGAGYGE